MEIVNLELENPTKDQVVHLGGRGRKYPYLGLSIIERLGRPWSLLPLQTRNIKYFTYVYIYYSFTKTVWEKAINHQNLKNSWKGNTFLECFMNWFEDKTIPTQIVAHICCFIWLEQNKSIFEDSIPSIQAVLYKTLALQNRVTAPLKDRPPRDILISHESNASFARFDGAMQLNGISCGEGGVIKTPDSTVIRCLFNCGKGTNT